LAWVEGYFVIQAAPATLIFDTEDIDCTERWDVIRGDPLKMAARGVVRARAALERIGWGVQEVGLLRTVAGLARLASIAALRTPRVEVKTATSGFRIAFNYPAQLMPLLVIFQELLDPEFGLLNRLLGPGRVAVDVGASIGTWTLWAAKTGATVHACEPDFENLSVLKENVRTNGLESNVVTHDCALGADEGWSTAHEDGGGYSIKFRLAAEAAQPHGKRVCSLDHFVRKVGLERIDVLKINTAGCESDVLIGGKELFRQEKVGVAMFLDGLEVRPLLDELKQFSYELGFYDGRNRKFVPVKVSTCLDKLRPGPMNRYVLVKHSSVYLPTLTRG
jgi:FkbM family methyltransferase